MTDEMLTCPDCKTEIVKHTAHYDADRGIELCFHCWLQRRVLDKED